MGWRRARRTAGRHHAHRPQRCRTAAGARLPHRRIPRLGRWLSARAGPEDAAAAARRRRRHRDHDEPADDTDRWPRRHAGERSARPRQAGPGDAAGVAPAGRRAARRRRPGSPRQPVSVDRSGRARADLRGVPRPRDPPLRLPPTRDRTAQPAHRRAPPPGQLGTALVPVRLRHGARTSGARTASTA